MNDLSNAHCTCVGSLGSPCYPTQAIVGFSFHRGGHLGECVCGIREAHQIWNWDGILSQTSVGTKSILFSDESPLRQETKVARHSKYAELCTLFFFSSRHYGEVN